MLVLVKAFSPRERERERDYILRTYGKEEALG